LEHQVRRLFTAADRLSSHYYGGPRPPGEVRRDAAAAKGLARRVVAAKTALKQALGVGGGEPSAGKQPLEEKTRQKLTKIVTNLRREQTQLKANLLKILINKLIY
jgi:hypothetical protein